LKRYLAGLGLLIVVGGLSSGCSMAARGTVACSSLGSSVTICINGKPLSFKVNALPHVHDGQVYAPVEAMADQLGVKVQVHLTVDQKSAVVDLNGKPFQPNLAKGQLGVHVHGATTYVPVTEFAKAAGLQVLPDEVSHAIGLLRN
jgi:hypothetical protein